MTAAWFCLFGLLQVALARNPFQFIPPSVSEPSTTPHEPPHKTKEPHTAKEALATSKIGEPQVAAMQKALKAEDDPVKQNAIYNDMPHVDKDEEEEANRKSKFMDSKNDAAETFNDAAMENTEEMAENSQNLIEEAKEKGSETALDKLAEVGGEEAPSPAQQECLRDFSVACPNLFVEMSTGCDATKEYHGTCTKHQIGLQTLTHTQKAAWAMLCEAEYPCMPVNCPHGTDWEALCPVGWSQKGDVECQAPEFFDECKSLVNFATYSRADKSQLEATCGVRWPCNADPSAGCKRDFISTPCPLSWRLLTSGACEAPPDYTGKCPRWLNLSEYSAEERQNFAEECNGIMV